MPSLSNTPLQFCLSGHRAVLALRIRETAFGPMIWTHALELWSDPPCVIMYISIVLSRPIYIVCTDSNIILRRGFIYVKILEWNVNKSASRLEVYAPKVELYNLQFFADFTRMNIKYIFTPLNSYFTSFQQYKYYIPAITVARQLRNRYGSPAKLLSN